MDLQPIFWEYYDDKFTSNNECKHALGKMGFYHGIGKKGGSKIEHTNIIDFNTSDGKPIDSVKTLWSQKLVDFHHELLNKYFPTLKDNYFDASAWFLKHGISAKNYYKNFLKLFLKHGILLENFMLDEKEIGFTKEIVLPALIEIYEETGEKALIVALEPTDIEGAEFWMCHPYQTKEDVNSKAYKETEKYTMIT